MIIDRHKNRHQNTKYFMMKGKSQTNDKRINGFFNK